MVKYISKVFLYFLFIIGMVGLTVLVKNDYILTIIYLIIIAGSVTLKKERSDILVLIIGFLGTLIGEYIFISTGIETFTRTSLFGIMPLWLPFLWAFIFLSMKRIFWLLVKDYWHIQLR